MKEKITWFIKNDVVFWLFFIILALAVIIYVLKKEGIKITVTFSESYDNRVISIIGD